MNPAVMQDPLFLMLLGFALAMSLVVVVLALKRPAGYPTQGYTSPTAAYANEGSGDRRNLGCIAIPLLIVTILMVFALLS